MQNTSQTQDVYVHYSETGALTYILPPGKETYFTGLDPAVRTNRPVFLSWPEVAEPQRIRIEVISDDERRRREAVERRGY